MSNCPNADVLTNYVSGSLVESAAEALSDHLEHCFQCQRCVDAILKRSDSLVDAMRRSVADPAKGFSPQLSQLIVDAQHLGAARPASGRRTQANPPGDTLALDVFVSGLRKCGLLDPSEVALLVESVAPSDSESFARELIARRKLTPFQAKALLQGRWKGLVLGNYIILDKIGQGGMGHVFKARHRRMGRVVCIKVLASAGRKSPALIERFRREAKTVAALNHPNIVVAHDADEADGIHFLVMEFIEGIDLARLVEKNGPMPVEQAMPLMLQVAQALDYAHRKGIVHRDIKPHNLLLAPSPNSSHSNGGNEETVSTDSGVIKILDMGLARFDSYLGQNPDALTSHASMTNSGVIMGTVDYMSPEQALNSRHADCRSDIYSLGCTLCFLLTGRVLFDGETLMEKLVAHREQLVPSLRGVRREIPVEVDAIFQQMVAKQPGRRYECMSQLAADLERFLAGGRPLALQRMNQAGLLQIKRVAWSGIAVAIAVLLGLGVWFTPFWHGAFQHGAAPSRNIDDAVDAASATLPAACAEEPVIDREFVPVESPDIPASPEIPAQPSVRVKSHERTKLKGPDAGPPPRPQTPAVAVDVRDKLLARGGPGRVLLIISHEGFHESDYEYTLKSLESQGIDFVTTSSRPGPATSKNRQISVNVERPLGEFDARDFDAIIFCSGDIVEFNDQSSDSQKQLQHVVTECLLQRRAVVGIGNGLDVLRDIVDLKEAAVANYREIQLVMPKDRPGSIIAAPDGQHADALMRFIFHEFLGGHANTLANGGHGRAMVVVSAKGFNAAEYTSLCNALVGWGIEVVTASSVMGTATPNDKRLDPVQVDATLENFDVRDFDAVIFCGGNLVEFKARPALPKIRQIVDACLSQRRVVASVGNGSVILKETGSWDCSFRDDRGLQIGRPKDGLGRVITAPGPKQADLLVEVLFGDVLRKEMQQPRVSTTPRDDPRP